MRGFAQYLAAIDNLTEVPPPGLFPHHPKRVTPYIYSNREIALLLAAALSCRLLADSNAGHTTSYWGC